jgi:alpha-glucosidase (family GH31 glycosyl hydrolase)
VIDYLHWDHFGDFALNKKCWPDPAAMIQELDSLDIRAMISIWPFVQSGDVYGHDYNATGKSTNFDAMHAGNMLVQVYTDTGSQTDRQTDTFRHSNERFFWRSDVYRAHRRTIRYR